MANLLDGLSLSARADYSEAGSTQAKATEVLRCINELTVVIAAQWRSTVEGKPAYPDAAFVDVMIEKSESGGCGGNLRWAVERADKRLRQGSDPDQG